MAFSNTFRLNVTSRVALLAVLVFALFWSLLRTGWDATPLVCALLLVAVIAELIRYVEKGTRDLDALLRAVANGDFTTALPRRGSGSPFAEYEQASRALMDTYQRLELQRAASNELLSAVIEHAGVALICFDRRGRVAFMNTAARHMLGSPAATGVASFAATEPALPPLLLALEDDERARLSLTLRGEPAHILLHARRFRLVDEDYTVVALHNIGEELESRDVEAWQSLTRVLTHEMMNSLTPIMSLSGVLREALQEQRASDAPPESDDLARSVAAIHERSTGLVDFVQSYRQFSNPPAPMPAVISAAELLDRVARLKRSELASRGIRLDVVADASDATLSADPHQIEQVLINLIHNAQQALEDTNDPCITLSTARDEQGRTLIQVTDNGPGIDPSLLSKLFVPFFTTRRGGTGIGLSLSRQIMQLNRGRISVRGTPGACTFTLRFGGR